MEGPSVGAGGFGPPTFAKHPLEGSVPNIKKVVSFIMRQPLSVGAGGFGPPTFAKHPLEGSVPNIKEVVSFIMRQPLSVGAGGFGPPTSRSRTVRSIRAEPRPAGLVLYHFWHFRQAKKLAL